jgi:hypothetical protein
MDPIQFLAGLAGLAALAAAAPAAPAIPTPGCPPDLLEGVDRPSAGAGPLRLSLLACVSFGRDSSGSGDPIVSPDGASIARWQIGSPGRVAIAALDRPGLVSVPSRATFRNFAGIVDAIHGTAPDALAWARDSRSLWAVRQRAATPGGWAHAGLEPLSIGRDGRVRALPPLRHPAGPLDAILWVGGRGLALAQFGTHGGYYRPAHDDPAPTLAMVDAARGRVLASLPALEISGLSARVRANGLMVSGAAATILPDGRIRAVVQFARWRERPPGAPPGQDPIIRPGLWLVWTQGEPPRQWTAPYADRFENSLALTPDGSKLLVVRWLQPDGVQIGCRIRCPGPPPPPPTPVDGPVAELIDVASRRVLWRVPARAVQFWRQSAPPAISPDGRYALIEVPPDGDRAPIALIDMRSGRVVQRIAPSHIWSYKHSFGFTAGGRRVWVEAANIVYVYALSRR